MVPPGLHRPGSRTHLYAISYFPLFFRVSTCFASSMTLRIPKSTLPSVPAENPQSEVRNGEYSSLHQVTRYIFGVLGRHNSLLGEFPFVKAFSSRFAALPLNSENICRA